MGWRVHRAFQGMEGGHETSKLIAKNISERVTGQLLEGLMFLTSPDSHFLAVGSIGQDGPLKVLIPGSIRVEIQMGSVTHSVSCLGHFHDSHTFMWSKV